jgi:radical SAM protein with 4Fe4S-binding SPASM domain
VKFWLAHRVIDHLRGGATRQTVRTRLVEHAPTVRGLVLTVRSVAEFGLTLPQRFSSPLFCVWNFTNRCNLQCRHCYQNAAKSAGAGELTLEEKLDVVDQLGRMYVPMLALAGGEPTMSPDLLPVLKRAQTYGMHTTIATNGTTMTPRLAEDLAAAGVRYVEISLDSVDPARHDAFRGQEGMWQRSVAGMRTVVAAPGLRLGVAMCVHRGNVHEVRAMLDFAISLGAGCFAHFNFIPVGRGLKMVEGDLTPRQHEELLSLLNQYMQQGKIGVISTAPQFGRVALAQSDADSGRTACSHAGSGGGKKARVVAKYLGGCGAGRTYICMEPAGDVTPCVYLPHRVMGNVRQTPIQQIFRESVYHDLMCDRDQRLHHCRTCAFKLYCGGCRARADAYFGELHGGDPGCIFNSRHWDALVAQGTVAASENQPLETMKLSPTRHGPG